MLRYTLTLGGLLLLTTLTLGLSFLQLGPFAVPVAMAIAVAKSVLVALFFMHLVEQRTTNWVAFVVSLLIAGTLIGLAALDVLSRAQVHLPPPILPG